MKTVIEMAMEVGGTVLAVYSPDLERFAELVRVTEREECAKVADSMDPLQDGAIGAAILARGSNT